jgi:hypothetical protein
VRALGRGELGLAVGLTRVKAGGEVANGENLVSLLGSAQSFWILQREVISGELSDSFLKD